MSETEFKPGDRVLVTDAGLAALRDIMRRATGAEPAPNHHGTIDEVWEDGATLLINFDDGMGAPYPRDEVRHLPTRPSQDAAGDAGEVCNCGWGGVHDPDNPRCQRNSGDAGRET